MKLNTDHKEDSWLVLAPDSQNNSSWINEMVTERGSLVSRVGPIAFLTSKNGKPATKKSIMATAIITILLFALVFFSWLVLTVLANILGCLFWPLIFGIVAWLIHPIVVDNYS